MDTKLVFHGSDIEKICSYYNLKKEDIVKFGANVNPLGLSPRASQAIASHIELLLFVIPFPATAIFRLILSFRETAPVN